MRISDLEFRRVLFRSWNRRASWSGYARALQLQSAEVDEIDAFSWGCGLQIPGRPLRSTTLDLFDRFDAWAAALADPDPLAWRDALPTAIGAPAGATKARQSPRLNSSP